MSWLDLPGLLLVLAFPLWFTLFPTNAVRFYRWFYAKAGTDQRRIDALTPLQFRIGGVLFLAFYILMWVFAKR